MSIRGVCRNLAQLTNGLGLQAARVSGWVAAKLQGAITKNLTYPSCADIPLPMLLAADAPAAGAALPAFVVAVQDEAPGLDEGSGSGPREGSAAALGDKAAAKTSSSSSLASSAAGAAPAGAAAAPERTASPRAAPYGQGLGSEGAAAPPADAAAPKQPGAEAVPAPGSAIELAPMQQAVDAAAAGAAGTADAAGAGGLGGGGPAAAAVEAAAAPVLAADAAAATAEGLGDALTSPSDTTGLALDSGLGLGSEPVGESQPITTLLAAAKAGALDGSFAGADSLPPSERHPDHDAGHRLAADGQPAPAQERFAGAAVHRRAGSDGLVGPGSAVAGSLPAERATQSASVEDQAEQLPRRTRVTADTESPVAAGAHPCSVCD